MSYTLGPWTQQVATAANTWCGVAWSPELSLFCAVSSDGTHQVMTSPDGLIWTPHDAATAVGWSSIAWSPTLGLFAASVQMELQTIMTSPDGVNWSIQTCDFGMWIVNGLIWAGGAFAKFMMLTNSGDKVALSSDGITWNVSSTVGLTANDYWRPIWSETLQTFVVAGQNPGDHLATSTDGINWTMHTDPAGDINRGPGAWSPTLGRFSLLSLNTTDCATSPTGATWTAQAAAPVDSSKAVQWIPELELFLSVSNVSSQSADGLTWTTLAVPTGYGFFALAWSPSLLRAVAVSQSGKVMTITAAAPVAVTITPTNLPVGATGTAYSQQLTGHGGDAGPYTFAVQSGTLPAGLTLSTGGLLSGTPTAGASLSPTSLPGATVDVEYSQQLSVTANVVSTFTVRATDGSANTGDQAYTLTVDARTAPYTYELVEDLGELPTCMTCSVLGLIAGTPYCVGVWTITARATDALGVTTDRAYTFTATS